MAARQGKYARQILSFTLAEKIKSGLVWSTQILEAAMGRPAMEKRAAEETVRLLISMVGGETRLALKVTGDDEWMEAGKDIDLALVMMESGVPQEGAWHMTRALTKVTAIGQRALSELKRRGLV